MSDAIVQFVGGDGSRVTCAEEDEPLARAFAAAGLLADAAVRDVVKENPRRRVGRADFGGAGFIVKRHRPARGFERIKEAFRGDRARREWDTARTLIAAGLPVPRPLLIASRSDGAALFVGRAVPEATPLGGWLEARFRAGDGRAAEKDPWLERAAALLARMHRAGFDHRDFHGGNLLVDGAGELWIIDLHRVAHRRPSARRRVNALADLVHSLRYALDDGAPAVALAAYLRAAEQPPGSLPVSRLRSRLRDRERERLRSRRKRCGRESSSFARVKRGGVRGWRRREVDEAALIEAGGRARAAIAQGATEVRSLSRRAAVAALDMGGRPVAVKVYFGDGWRSLRGRRLKRSRAFRAYSRAFGLELRHLPAARPLAILQAPDCGIAVFEALEGAPLHALSFRLERSRALAVADAVAAALEAYFEARVDAGDWSPKNVLVREVGGGFEARLCDFDGIAFRRRLSPRRLLRALAQVGDVARATPPAALRRALRRLRRRFPALRGRAALEALLRRMQARRRRRLARPDPLAVDVLALLERP